MANAKILEKKSLVVDEIKGKFENAKSVVVFDPRGLNVAEVTELRKALRESGSDYKVYKNTLFRRAVEGTDYEGLTEDLVGPYELHDFVLYHVLRFGFSPSKIFFLSQKADLPYDDKTKLKWLKTFYKRFFSQQFKRSCMPDGAKVGTVNLSPRGDWRMPSDASAEIWLKEVDEINL